MSGLRLKLVGIPLPPKVVAPKLVVTAAVPSPKKSNPSPLEHALREMFKQAAKEGYAKIEFK